MKKAVWAVLITCVFGSAPLQAKNWSNESPHRVQQAAEQGDIEAQYRLAELYALTPYQGDQALAWLTKAAEQGHADAQFRLGRMYENTGNPGDMAQEAFEMTEQQYMYNHMCEYITEGTQQQLMSQALPWYRKAAEQNHAGAQFTLGWLYAHCLLNESQDGAIQAAAWFQKAAEQGHPEAQIGLSGMYLNGRGVTQNNELAYVWCAIAVANGRTFICDNIITTPEELNNAQALIKKHLNGIGKKY